MRLVFCHKCHHMESDKEIKKRIQHNLLRDKKLFSFAFSLFFPFTHFKWKGVFSIPWAVFMISPNKLLVDFFSSLFNFCLGCRLFLTFFCVLCSRFKALIAVLGSTRDNLRGTNWAQLLLPPAAFLVNTPQPCLKRVFFVKLSYLCRGCFSRYMSIYYFYCRKFMFFRSCCC